VVDKFIVVKKKLGRPEKVGQRHIVGGAFFLSQNRGKKKNIENSFNLRDSVDE